MHGLTIQGRDKRNSISTSLRQRLHISYNRRTKLLLIMDNFSFLLSLTALRLRNETSQRKRVRQSERYCAYLIFPLSHPSLISQHRVLAALRLGVGT